MGNAVIYRPAYDAEVEYLESTGTQWIDTGVKPDSTYTFDCKVAFTSAIDGNYVPWGCRDMQNNAITAQCFLFVSNMTSYDGTKLRLITTNSWADSENWNSGIVPIPNTMYELVGMTSVSNMEALNSDIAIFGFITNGFNNSGSSRCRIGYWKCYSNGVLVRDMIPVRVGSTGYMYDKVSKQLFANKGTGNFILGNDVSNAVIPQQRCVLYFGSQRSVGFERIYEEYEWLKGDRAATLYLGNYNDKVEFDCRLNVPSSVTYGFIYGYNGVLRTYKSGNYNEFRTEITENRITSISPIPVSDLHVSLDFNNHNVYVNETKMCYTDKHSQEDAGGNEQAYKQAYFFGSLVWESFNSDGLLGNVIADGKSFIPCKLLQSIPAILDGNGIARQAGECGMWDKVSNRFYGNVANSGTFTVKGPKCYEEYKWLVTTIPVGVLMMSLPLDSYNFYYQRIWQVFGNVAYFQTEGHTYFTLQNNRQVAIYDISTGQSYTYSSYPKIDAGELMTVDSNSTRTLIHNVEVERYAGEATTYIKFQNAGNGVNTAEYSTSAITVDGSLRYVPCKLTHGIPASMDANGISRPAGTCGMWDKVNDKFYGNVANSGSFTVSND